MSPPARSSKSPAMPAGCTGPRHPLHRGSARRATPGLGHRTRRAAAQFAARSRIGYDRSPAAIGAPLDRTRGVSVTRGAMRAARDISFRIAAGDALRHGRAGSDKTDRRAARHRRPNSPHTAEGRRSDRRPRVSNRRPRDSRKIIQMVFQDPYRSLHPNQTVDQTLSAPIAIHAPRRAKAASWPP